MKFILFLWKTNPFIFVATILNFVAAIWYFKNGGWRLGMLFILYGLTNITILSLGVK